MGHGRQGESQRQHPREQRQTALPALDGQPTPAARRVAILVGTTGSYGRGIVRGIATYNREHARWSTYFHPQVSPDTPPAWLSQWRGDGVIAHVDARGYGNFFRRIKCPIVNLRLMSRGRTMPYVGVCHAAVGALGAEHLMSRGLRHFGFYGSARGIHLGLDERGHAFRKALADAGHACAMHLSGRSADEREWAVDQQKLSRWLATLPKPVGIMASNDERGLQVLAACRACGFQVPDQVAVLGVDNDDMMCDLAIPPMSSIDINGERVGYEAAAMLDALIDGQPSRSGALFLAPKGVVMRRSTDVVASEDEEVNRAVRFIREHAGRSINVVDVLAHLNVSRAALQQRMKRVLGRTIHEEIEAVRLALVKDLLAMSDLTIKQIAQNAGFSSVQYLTRVFRASVGETPAQFRRQRQT